MGQNWENRLTIQHTLLHKHPWLRASTRSDCSHSVIKVVAQKDEENHASIKRKFVSLS